MENESENKPAQNFEACMFFDLQNYMHKELFKTREPVWKALDAIESYISNYSELKRLQSNYKTVGSVYIDTDQPVHIGLNTVVEHGAMIKGPTIIGQNCEIRSGAYIRGNVIIGDNCVIGHATELKNSILLNNVQAAHFNYVGDSILGNNAHLGAGSIISNLRLDNKTIRVNTSEEKQFIDTGRKKLGAIIGDNSQVGCNAVINPGTFMGRNCIVHPGVQFKGTLSDNSVVKGSANYEMLHK
jgi:NDP-sugar pyrophosphorylase family protein